MSTTPHNPDEPSPTGTSETPVSIEAKELARVITEVIGAGSYQQERIIELTNRAFTASQRTNADLVAKLEKATAQSARYRADFETANAAADRIHKQLLDTEAKFAQAEAERDEARKERDSHKATVGIVGHDYNLMLGERNSSLAQTQRLTEEVERLRKAVECIQWVQKERGHESYFYICAGCGRDQESINYCGHHENCIVNNALTPAPTESAPTAPASATPNTMHAIIERQAHELSLSEATVAAVIKERDALRLCFAEASHNAGPAFVAHEELNRLKQEADALRRQLAEAQSSVKHWRDKAQKQQVQGESAFEFIKQLAGIENMHIIGASSNDEETSLEIAIKILATQRDKVTSERDQQAAELRELRKDREMLDWIFSHGALVHKVSRQMTRRAGLTKDNLESVWVVDYEADDGSEIWQTPDSGKASPRESIDAAMKL